jgi:phage baseplate assembly protein W
VSDIADFIGRGISYPLRVDQSGSIALVEGGDGIDASIRMALSTAPGERVMRPQFGCRIWDLLFEPVNANTLGLMAEAVRDALSQWEPRIEVEDVEVEPDPASPARVVIRIAYRMRATNDRRNLVYPFYVIPHEEEGAL